MYEVHKYTLLPPSNVNVDSKLSVHENTRKYENIPSLNLPDEFWFYLMFRDISTSRG